MGCCFSSCKETENQDGTSDERTHLLNDPVCNSSSIQRVQSDDFLVQYPDTIPKKSDEQTVLNKILQETATNVIDVAALAPNNLEQNEYLERRSHYNSKLNPTLWHGDSKPQPRTFLVDIAVPEKVLIPAPVSALNIILIKSATTKFRSALSDLRVVHTEDLIVPFEIP